MENGLGALFGNPAVNGPNIGNNGNSDKNNVDKKDTAQETQTNNNTDTNQSEGATSTSQPSDANAPSQTAQPQSAATPPAPETTQSAVQAQLNTSQPEKRDSEVAQSTDLREALARSGAEKAMTEARQMQLIDQIKSPALGSGQIVALTPDAPANKGTNPYTIAQSDAVSG